MFPFYYDVIDLFSINIDRSNLEPSNKPKKIIKASKKVVQAHKKIYRKQGR